MVKKSLETIRKEMREKDEEIILLLNERASLALEIGSVKRDAGIAPYDATQENRVLNHLLRISKGALPKNALLNIYREILSSSRALQKEPMIAFLGPEASFCNTAAIAHFGGSSTFVPAKTISDIFDQVEQRKSDWGVVPIENSLEGSVKPTLDRLVSTPLKIRAEIFLRISHNLLSSSASLGKIKKIYSHPQALAQCRKWLQMSVPGAQLFETDSTTAAARTALREPASAAIASAMAADRYELNVLAESIEDHPLNTTRFVVIGNREGLLNAVTGRDKTSVLFGAAHLPGALHQALAPFAAAGLNLLRIESYPMRERNWEYLFFLDFEGHIKDKAAAVCLSELKKVTRFDKVLGSYPVGFLAGEGP